MTTVTVLVPTFNRRRTLAQTLESLGRQRVSPYQIIVVDNGSTDDTPSFLAALPNPPLLLSTPTQSGKAAALNFALPFVEGEAVWVLDDDDVAYPDAIERIGAAFDAVPEAQFVFGAQDVADEMPDGRIGPVALTRENPAVAGRDVFARLLDTGFLSAARLAVRTSHARAVGGYSEELLRSQDYDFALRVAHQAHGVPIPGRALFILRRHSGPRGPRHEQHAADARFSKWLEYDQRIFRRLYSSLPLHEYFAPAQAAVATRRLLLLRRAQVMRGKLLDEEMYADLTAALDIEPTRPFDGAEQRLFDQLLSDRPYYTGESILQDPKQADRLVKRLQGSSALHRSARRRFRRVVLRASVRERALPVRQALRLMVGRGR